MVWREFYGKYLGSVLGSIWSIIHPISMIVIYTVIFSKFMRARLPDVKDDLGFGIFLCAGLLTWGFFSELLGRCPTVFIEKASLIKKVNFPRIILPVVLFLSCAVNFIIIFGIFVLFLLVTNRFPGSAIIAFIPLLLFQQMFALGLGIILGTFNVFFRDVGQFINVVLQFWFWFTPIIYPISILPERIKNLVLLNPMTQFVVAYQEIILYGKWPSWDKFIIHIIVSLLIVFLGFMTFKNLAAEILDEI